MRRALAAALALAMGVAHAAGKPLVRVNIEGKPLFLVGQQIKVDVQVLVPNFFTSAPQWPALDVPGAVVTLSEGSALNLSETIGGETYAGIQQTYLIVAQQDGEFTLPPARITFQYAAEPGKPPADGVVTLPPQGFTAKLPEGAQAAGGTPPVAKVTITQTLDRDLEGLKVGDALTRTVDAFAEGTQAMMIPPPRFDVPTGVRVYPQDPVLTEVTQDRLGFVGGRRVDRATYVFEKPGDYTLPAIEIGWFNAATGRREVARAPEVKVSIAPNRGFKPAIAPEAAEAPAPAVAKLDWARWLLLGIGVLAAGLVLAWLARRYGPRYRAWTEARRRAREGSEPADFARVEEACRANSAAAAYQSLGAWSRRAGSASIAAMSAEAGEAALRREIATLERALFTAMKPTGGWRGQALLAELANARKAWLAQQVGGTNRRSALPALNP